MRSLLALPAAVLLLVGLAGCDTAAPSATANGAWCELDCPDPDPDPGPGYCPPPPSPRHDWATLAESTPGPYTPPKTGPIWPNGSFDSTAWYATGAWDIQSGTQFSGGYVTSLSLETYLDKRQLDLSPGNQYRLQGSFEPNQSYVGYWAPYSPYGSTHPTNPDFFVRTAGKVTFPYIRVERTCPDGGKSYSQPRAITDAPSFPQGWHQGAY
jgi:hypothetical protein